ncbi:unnamed protein product [Dracunculus medinensis]|uniref:GLOBIN domain-containing protein n=1 Tax=Dracunculus medinensis TaxID=318479 RepID=A0A0N4UE59_DRAME|nr:unnamed protein product [Dracunculus medinensis]
MGHKFSTHPSSEETECDSLAKCSKLTASQRDIVIEGFENASEDITQRIVMRMLQQREDFRTFMDDLSPDLRKILIMQLKQYLHSVIDNIDDAEKKQYFQIKLLSSKFGMEHVILKRFGFKTDFFALMANSIATECAFLSDTTTSATTTFKAWINLVGFMFSAVRDGFYKELRFQRHLPHQPLTSSKSLSDLNMNANQFPAEIGPTDCKNCKNDKEERSIKDNTQRDDTLPVEISGTKETTRSNELIIDECERPTRALQRKDAFYVAQSPQIYKKRSRSAYQNINLQNAQSSAEGDRLEMTKIKFEMLNEQHKKVSI